MASNIALNIVDTNNPSKVSDNVGKLFDSTQLVLKYMIDHSVDHPKFDCEVCNFDCVCCWFYFCFLCC